MRQQPRILRYAFIIILCVFQALSFPIPMQSESVVEVNVEANSNKEVLVHTLESQQKPAIRKYPQVMSKLIAVTHNKPVFLVLALLLMLRIPTPRLPFKPLICLFKRRLFLLPIKFTSMYVSPTPIAPNYVNAYN
ncbi:MULTISPECIES: hypothetical protein [unclassified Paenibacillus]|uniref:hypothetical protein n=1 Tax=unclassified Paenibacillus TaxID=185978 RepID=UPI0003F851EE|nr:MULTISPECIES: hypothetical protein [unclassified Paenibacillus]KGP80749.1 hypothetical protein P363_0129610 [Paenibacillus sp. MAEPY1]KGP84207.1 hypothetical protein P364_0104680 [Paenibacillus sp. MAEPY2]